MRDVLEGLRRWRADGRRFALATVVRTWSSAPRPAGAVMVVAEDGEVLGSVSGGCVEGAVHDAALRVLGSGVPELCRFGVSSEEAFDVGLTCGGELEVHVEPVEPGVDAPLDRLLEALVEGRAVVLTTALGTPGSHVVEEPAADAREGADVVETAEGSRLLVQSFAAPPRMIVFGAIDFAEALTRIGRFLGYRVTLCDARPVFATEARFPAADEVVVDWPHRYLAGQHVDASTVLCVLTHDPKFDVPLLEAAVRTDAGYIGVMGSRRVHADRLERLRARGVDEASLARLHGPIGLDLGARTPAETAVSIAAEIIAARETRTGRPLRELDVPIHAVPQLLCGA